MMGFSMKTILFLGLMLSVSGCSLVSFEDSASKLAIQYATAKYIEQGNVQKRAMEIIAEVDRATAFLDVQSVPVADLKRRVIERVAVSGLSTADTLLATALIDTIDVEIGRHVKTGVISDDEKVRVNGVLNIIRRTAAIYL